jgi:hypothetical protein
VLCNFASDVDSASSIPDFDRIVDRRKFCGWKSAVHNGAEDLNYFSGARHSVVPMSLATMWRVSAEEEYTHLVRKNYIDGQIIKENYWNDFS